MHTALATDTSQAPRAQSFLKWAGGKAQLVPEIMARFPERFGRYYEPFLGGGAVFFALAPQRGVLADINASLIGTYRSIRDELPAVLSCLRRHQATPEHYYEVRAWDPSQLSSAEAAARFIFLNRTCFNGLYRVNRSGEFNVPFGKYKNPKICNEERLDRVADALAGVELMVTSVFDLFAQRRVRRGDLVYFDPPYDPVSPTASFTSYTSTPFGREEQVRLAQLFAALANRGARVVLSNSDTPFINELYRDFRIDKVQARRAINSCASRRGPVSEVLVSYP